MEEFVRHDPKPVQYMDSDIPMWVHGHILAPAANAAEIWRVIHHHSGLPPERRASRAEWCAVWECLRLAINMPSPVPLTPMQIDQLAQDLYIHARFVTIPDGMLTRTCPTCQRAVPRLKYPHRNDDCMECDLGIETMMRVHSGVRRGDRK